MNDCICDMKSVPPGSAVRDRFPILNRRMDGRPLVYLDTAATSQKPAAVIGAETRFYLNSNASVHRGVYALAEEATDAFEAARSRVAAWLKAPAPESVVVTHGTTSALNGIARGIEGRIRPGDEILLTEMEHHANLVPWILLAKRKDAVLRHVPVTDGGELDLSAFRRLLSPRTRVVSFAWVSNVLGTINPAAALAEEARRVGALSVVDAAQAAGHLPMDFSALGADLLVFSSHKCYGPAGLGYLVGRPEALESLDPWEGGGQMIERVSLTEATWTRVPHRFEGGTPNAAAAVAFPCALDLLEEVGPDAVRRQEKELAARTWEGLSSIPGLVLYGPADPEKRGSLVSFYDPKVHPHDQAAFLGQSGIAVRAGHHCAQPLHDRLGVPATTRASFGVYTTVEEIDALVEAVREARRFFTR